LKVCNVRARTVTVSGACLALTLHTEQGVFGTLLPYMCPQQYSTILASLFQTDLFAQRDESERLHTSFDLMHVNEKIDSGSVHITPSSNKSFCFITQNSNV